MDENVQETCLHYSVLCASLMNDFYPGLLFLMADMGLVEQSCHKPQMNCGKDSSTQHGTADI